MAGVRALHVGKGSVGRGYPCRSSNSPRGQRMDVSKGAALALTALPVLLLARMPRGGEFGSVAPTSMGCPGFDPVRALSVALEELRAHPTRYQGRSVRVRGGFVDGFEMSALYPGPPVQDPWAAASIWVDGIAPTMLPSEQAVELTGIVSAAVPGAPFGKGHLG